MLPLPREALRPRCSFLRPAASDLTTTRQQGRIDELLAPFTRFRAGGLLRYAILAAGLAAMTAMTVPDFDRPTWIVGLLWIGLGFSSVEDGQMWHAAAGVSFGLLLGATYLWPRSAPASHGARDTSPSA